MVAFEYLLQKCDLDLYVPYELLIFLLVIS